MKKQKGSIVAMTAILMVALIAILGLAVDFGTAFTARTFAQHAADAGALAGADTYAVQPGNAGDGHGQCSNRRGAE